METSNDNIGNRICDLLARSAVPQPTGLLCAPSSVNVHQQNLFAHQMHFAAQFQIRNMTVFLQFILYWAQLLDGGWKIFICVS